MSIDDTAATVAAESSVTQSAILLIEGIIHHIKDAYARLRNAESNALHELIDKLEGNKHTLASAVTANTGREDPPAPTAEPEAPKADGGATAETKPEETAAA